MCREYLISDLAEGDRVCIVGGKNGGKAGTVLHVGTDKFLIRLDRNEKIICIRCGRNLRPIPNENKKAGHRDK